MRIHSRWDGVNRHLGDSTFLGPAITSQDLLHCPNGGFLVNGVCYGGSVSPIVQPFPTVQASGSPAQLVVTTTPTGTYTQSCQNIVYDPTTDTLTALCENMAGTWQQSTLFHANGGYVAGSIFNDNGQLGGQPLASVATPGTTQQPNIVAPDVTPPPGGYQQIEAPGSPYVWVGAGQAPIPPNTYPAYLPPNYNYGSSSGGLTTAQQLALSHLSSTSSGGGFSSFWNQYKGWIIAGLVGLVVVPPVLKRVTR